MQLSNKSTIEEIRARFDGDVERFSNLETGQVATVDASLCMELVACAAAKSQPQACAALDVGCGAGNYSLRLASYLPALRFTLVDLSVPMIERAKLRLGTAVGATVAGDIRDCDFGSGSFDIILAAAVLHHLRSPEEWLQVFAKFHRWLRPGGGVWVFDLVSHEDREVQEMMWGRYERYLESQGGVPYREQVCRYIEKEDSPTSVAFQLDLLRKVGFSAIDILHKNSCFVAYGAVKAPPS